jgi:hypothetical protein
VFGEDEVEQLVREEAKQRQSVALNLDRGGHHGGPSSWRSGRLPRDIEEPRSPRRSFIGSTACRHINPVARCWDQPHCRDAGTDDGGATGQALEANALPWCEVGASMK